MNKIGKPVPIKLIAYIVVIVAIVWLAAAIVAGDVWYAGSTYDKEMEGAKADFECIWGPFPDPTDYTDHSKQIAKVLARRDAIASAAREELLRRHPASIVTVPGWWNRNGEITTPDPAVMIFW